MARYKKIDRIKGNAHMLQQEFKKLLDLFSQNEKTLHLEDLLAETLLFFEKLKEAFREISQSEKKEMLPLLTEMQDKLQSEMKIICERLSLSEEDLQKMSENPSHFSPEQWKFMQEAKQKMTIAGAEVNEAIKREEPIAEVAAEKAEKKMRKRRKDTWMRS